MNLCFSYLINFFLICKLIAAKISYLVHHPGHHFSNHSTIFSIADPYFSLREHIAITAHISIGNLFPCHSQIFDFTFLTI